MGNKLSRYGMSVSLIALLGISTMFGVRSYQWKEIRNSLEENLSATENTLSALKQKYSEEKAKGDALQRAKFSADAQMRDMESSLEEAKTALAAAADSENKMKEKVEAFKTDIDAISKKLETVTAERMDVREKLKKASMTIRSKDEELGKKQSDVENLQADLKNAKQKIGRLFKDNTEFTKLSQELLLQFDKKGALATMLEKEPFTQLERVRLEKMMQAYMDRIDRASETDSGLD